MVSDLVSDDPLLDEPLPSEVEPPLPLDELLEDDELLLDVVLEDDVVGLLEVDGDGVVGVGVEVGVGVGVGVGGITTVEAADAAVCAAC